MKILTGDNDIVTRKICKDVGLDGRSHRARQRDRDDERRTSLPSLAETTAVFAKLSPPQKARVIDALHRKGHVVGYLGDGINDGPALKAADVGISVDTAVDIAKESADIILLEKSLAVLGDGVLEGRKVFGNITKYIKMGASSNFGNMFSVLGASVVPAVPADDADPGAHQQPALRFLADDDPDRQRRRRISRRCRAAGTSDNIAKFVLFIGPISSIFDYVDVCADALRLRRLDRSGAVPDRLVRRIAAHADAHHPHHPHGAHSLRRRAGRAMRCC